MSDVESDDEETQPSREPPPLLLKLETTAGCSYIQQGTIPAQSFLAPYSMPSQFPISSGIMLPPSNVVSTTSTPRDSGIAYFPSIQSLSQSSLIPPESVKVENINVNGSVIPVYIPLSTASLGSTNSTEYCQPSMMLPFATKDRPLHQGIPSGVEGSARAPFFPPAIWQGTKLVPLSSAEHISQQSAGLPFSPSLLYSDRNSGTPAPTHLPPLVTRPYIQPILKHKQMTSAYSHHEPNRRDAQDSSELSRSSDSQRQSTVHKLVEVPIPLIGVSSSSSLPYQTASTVIPTGHENYNHNTSVPLPKSVMRSSIESYPAVLPRYIVPEHVQVKEKGTINTDAPKKKSVSSMEQFLRSKLQEPNTSSPVDVEDSIQAQIKSEPHLSSFCNFFKASKHSKYLRMRLLNTRGSANIVKWIEVTRSTSHIDDTSGPVDVVRILVSSNGLCKFQLIFPCSRTFFTRFVPSTQTLADDLLNNLSEEHVLCPGLVDFEADVISLGYQPAIVRLATTRSMKRYEHEKCEGWHIPTHYKIHSESNMAARHMCKPCKSLYHTVKQTLTKVSNTRHDCSSDSSASSLVSPSPTKTLSLLSPRGKFPHFDNVRRARKGKRKGLSKQKGSDAMDTGEYHIYFCLVFITKYIEYSPKWTYQLKLLCLTSTKVIGILCVCYASD